jgi:hypothetical protein
MRVWRSRGQTGRHGEAELQVLKKEIVNESEVSKKKRNVTGEIVFHKFCFVYFKVIFNLVAPQNGFKEGLLICSQKWQTMILRILS